MGKPDYIQTRDPILLKYMKQDGTLRSSDIPIDIFKEIVVSGVQNIDNGRINALGLGGVIGSGNNLLKCCI